MDRNTEQEIMRVVRERILEGARPYKLPMSDELLRECNFFDLYPLDGGGGLASHSLISTIDDAEYARQILEDDALADFGGLPNIDYRRFERWRSIEKSCWINRCYFMVPLAKRYALTHDESLARLLVDTVINFIDTCPPPEGFEAIAKHQEEVYYIRDNEYNARSFEENQADETDVRYIWFDFQPASRVLHFLHVVHFLKDSPSVTAEEWMKIGRSIYQHAEVIYYGEKALGKLSPGDNHQSLRGLMLLLGGTFFEGAGLWREFLDMGVKILNYHSLDGFAPDGSLKENSPSYHCFQTWHARDAYLLSREYGFTLDDKLADLLPKQAAFVRGVTDAGGMTVVVNDGYPVNGASFLKSMAFCDKSAEGGEALFFPDAGMAAVNTGDLYLFLDASPFTGTVSHYHGGKNAITLWSHGKPFMVDSGCSQYDDELFSKWYKLPISHSSLLVDGSGDGTMTSIYAFDTYATPVCSGWSQGENGEWRISSSLTSCSPTWDGITWTREITITSKSEVLVRDVVDSPREADFRFIYNLHPNVDVSIDGPVAELANGSAHLRAEWNSSTPLTLETADGKCYVDFENRSCRQVLCSLHDRGRLELNTIIKPDDRS